MTPIKDHEERFSILREKLQEEPSESLWTTLTKLLEQWDDPDVLREVVVPYTQQHLAHWDDKLRSLPNAWHPRTHDILQGKAKDDGLFSLGRGISLYRELHKEKELELICSPLFAEYTHLHLQLDNLTARDLKRVTTSPYTRNIKHLRLIWCKMGDEILPLLEDAGWPLLSLDLHGNSFSDDGLARLLQHPSLQELNKLELGYIDDVGIKSMEALRQGKHRLTHLSLDSCDGINREAIVALTKTETFKTLESLDLKSVSLTEYGNDNEEDGIGWVLNHAAITPPIKQLNLSFANVKDTDARQLASWKGLETLEQLELTFHYIQEDGFEQLSKAPLYALKHLDLSCSQELTDSGFSSLCRAPWLRNVEWIRFWSCSIGPARAEILAKEAQLDTLKELSLWENPLGSIGLHALFSHGQWAPMLESLNLSECGLGNAGLALLIERAQLPVLRELRVEQNNIDAQSAADFLSQLPFSSLKELHMCDNPLGGIGKAGPFSQHMNHLEELYITNAQLEHDDVVGICEALRDSQHIKHLSLNGNGALNDDTLAALLQSPFVGQLASLSMDHCHITERGGQQLLDAAAVLNHTHVSIENNDITDQALLDELSNKLDISLGRSDFEYPNYDEYDEYDEYDDELGFDL